jgi:hypothetical protein
MLSCQVRHFLMKINPLYLKRSVNNKFILYILLLIYKEGLRIFILKVIMISQIFKYS